jgi:hypothetical protein
MKVLKCQLLFPTFRMLKTKKKTKTMLFESLSQLRAKKNDDTFLARCPNPEWWNTEWRNAKRRNAEF